MIVDVAIVGCGPVGGVLATLLGRQGRSVVVLERHAERYPLPRAVHFDHETARILQACGLGDALPALSEPAPVYEWRNADGKVLLRFGGRPVGPSAWPDINMFWQPALERLVEEAAAAQPGVTIRRGVAVTGLTETPDGVVLATADGPPIEARYVVGCDGANSTVRDLIGATVTDLGFFYDWLIVDVRLTEDRVYDPVNLQVCDPVRPSTAVSGGPGRRRWEFMCLPGETPEQLDTADRAWELLAPWDVTPGNAELERHTVYRFHARWADTWRRGRVLLAGDAAHQMPPFAGQGMCSGIRDANNLAWKLALVLDGAAPDALLDTYAAEREENVRAVIGFSMELGKVICVSDPAEAAARDAAMSAGFEAGEVMTPPPLPGVPTGVIAEGAPLAGTLLPQGRVAGGARFDDVFGAGWRLLHAGSDSGCDGGDLAWFESIGGRVVEITPELDVDRTYTEWFAGHGVSAVLQRPDFYVFGTGDDLVGRLRIALTDSESKGPS